MIKRFLKYSAFTVLSLFIILVTLVTFLLTTTPGLYTTIKIANLFAPGNLSIKKPDGSILTGLSYQTLSYQDAALTFSLEQGTLSWEPKQLFNGALIIDALKAKELVIDIKENEKKDVDKPTKEKTDNQPFKLPELPIEIHITTFSIDEISIKQNSNVEVIDNLALKADFTGDNWSVKELSADNRGVHVALKMHANPHHPYNLEAKATIKEPTKGPNQLRGHLNLSGTLSRYVLVGEVSGPIQGRINGTLYDGERINLNTSWRNIQWPINDQYAVSSKSGEITVSGALSDLSIHSEAVFDKPLQANLTNTTHVKKQVIKSATNLTTPQGQLTSDIRIDPDAAFPYQGNVISKGVDLRAFNIPLHDLTLTSHVSGKSLETLDIKTTLTALYHEAFLKGHLNVSNQHVESAFELGPNQISAQGQLPYQWDIDVLLPQPSLLSPSLKGLNTSIKAHAKLLTTDQGTLSLTINPGRFQSPKQETLPPIDFKGGQIDATLDPKGLSATGNLFIDNNKKLDFNVKLPHFDLEAGTPPDQKLKGQLTLSIDTLDFINNTSPEIEKAQGQLSVKLNASGTFGNPKLTGLAKLTNASIYLPKLDLAYSPIQFELKTADNKWTSQGSLTSLGKTVSLSGTGEFYPSMKGAVSIKGDDVPAIKTAEYSINVSPDLTIDFSPGDLSIKGTVTVPTAKIKPITFSSTQSLTDDAIFVNTKEKVNPLNITTDITILMGENVELDVKGLTGKLAGDIRIQQQPNSSPFGTGELRIVDGKYQAYGQKLIIQEGQLLFGGGLISNPGIRVRAVRQFNNASSSFSSSSETFDFSSGNLDSANFGNNVTVGIEVSGRVSNPEIKLFSVPSSLSQADILSMLILGKPASQAGQSGGQLLLTAISAMDLDNGTKGSQLMSQLKQNIGLDFNLQQSSSYDQTTNETTDSTAFVIGKSITKRLYLSYNIGLFQNDGNVLTIKYLLNKYFSIQVSASDTGSGIDFLYNHVKD
jgi:translocation and assembly module TamB